MRKIIDTKIGQMAVAIVSFAVVLGMFAVVSLAQNIKNTDYSPDKALKGNARVNPSTLAMELSIPLIGYAGRAGNGMPVSLSYSSKVWGMENYGTPWINPLNHTVNDIRPLFARNTVAGWSSSLGTVRIDYSWDVYREAADQAPETEGQIYAPAPWQTPPPYDNRNLYFVKRLQVIMPDGSSHELRASDAPVFCGTLAVGNCTGNDFTGTFLSVDGSRMRLESGASSSTLYLPNGSRYLFGSPTGTMNLANAFYDVHGNMMTYNPTNREWTDTLGRVIEDPFPLNLGSIQNQTVRNQILEFPGFNGGDYEIELSWVELEDALLNPSDPLRYIGRRSCNGSGYTLLSPYLFEDGSAIFTRLCNLGPPFNPVVLSKITLPNSQFYEFKYNVFGEIIKVIYPSGAYERFAYSQVAVLQRANDVYDIANRGVTDRWVSERGDGTDEIHYHYSVTHPNSLAPYYVTTTAPDGSYTRQYLYTEPVTIPMNPYGFGIPYVGRPYEERVYDAGGSLRSLKLTAYDWTGPLGAGAHLRATRDIRPTKEIAITFEPGSSHALATMSETVYDTTGNSDPAYFSSLNPKQTKTYHYVVVNASTAASANITTAAGWFSAATPAIVTEMDYLYDANYKARGIIGLPIETRVLNPMNTSDVLAKSQFVYDEAAYFDNNYTTTNWEDPNSNLRGNVTTTRTWNKDTNTWIESHTMYDNFGNVRKVWDTSGDPTRFVESEYDPVYKYAYSTKTKAPAPDPTGVHGTTEGSEISRVYDFTTGLLLSVTDANGQTATTEYDALLRPIRINPPAGGSVTEIIYNDSPNDIWIKVRKQIDGQNWGEATSYLDNLGRVKLVQKKDSQGDIFVETKYDSFGRLERTSNPYRNGEQKLWSKPRYDHANRVVENFAPAPEGQTGASLGYAEFGISTVNGFVGTYVTATDASGRKARSIKNALGQILRVDEPTGNNDLGTLQNPNQPTFNIYDVRGNLIKVQQGQQNRYFMYDSLGRLTRVRQPEQTVNSNLNTTGNPENNNWTAGFTYDVLGNLLTVTDAKGTVVTNTYDNAGRVKTRGYSDGITSQVNYFYDGKGLPAVPQFSKGSLTKISNGVSETRQTSFDNLGRMLTSQQITDGQTYNFGYVYNASGDLIEQTYPSGRIVKNHLSSDGGLTAVSSRVINGDFKTYASNFDYDSAGNMNSMMLGNGKWETAQYNSRFQLTQIGLGNSATDTSLWKTQYEYGELGSGDTVDAAKNIGNIAKQTTTLSGTSFVQTYKYDEVNRLIEATEKTGSTQNWKQTFGYDRYGNRTQFSQTVGGIVTPNTNINHPAIDPATNRFTTGQGYAYDFNGNLVQDAEGRTFTFDGNDKQTEVKDANQNIIGRYYYDGEGSRVKKVTNTETTIFVYDGSGALAAEYSNDVSETPTTSYLTTDQLGSPRVITDKTGNVVSRRDFMPFGEELYAGVGPRTEGMKYAGSQMDSIRQRFTGYEKDWETELDFAEARMYQNKHGRFTAPDPLLSSASISNPQTFNRYIYTGNNPINYTDPMGLIWVRRKNGAVDWENEGYKLADGETDVTADYSGQELACLGICSTNGVEYSNGDRILFGSDGSVRVTRAAQAAASGNAPAAGTEVQNGTAEIPAASAMDHVHSALMTIGENNGGNVIDAVFDLQPYNQHTETGQRIGNAVTIVQGLAEIVGGLSMSGTTALATFATSPLCSTGIGCAVPATTATVSVTGMVVAAHGATVIGNTVYNMVNNQGSTLQPGPFAGRSIPARDSSRRFTGEERKSINDIGGESGCHTCGTKDPGTKSGNFVPDHQEPSKLNSKNKPQRLYPQCLKCSKKQGGQVRNKTR